MSYNSINNTFTANDTDPKISFDSFFQPLPGDDGGMQNWQDMSMGVDWSATNEFELLNNWNWFAGGLQTQDGSAGGGGGGGGGGDGIL